MSLIGSILRLSSDDLLSRIVDRSSGCSSMLGRPWRFNAHETGAVVRYQIALPEMEKHGALFFSVSFSLVTDSARAKHISVVNSDVTDGNLWEVQPSDSGGDFALNGILRAPVDHILAYINVDGLGEGAFCLRSLTIAPLEDAPLRIAFVIDPWIEQARPAWKKDYIWWFGLMEKALRATGQNVESHYVFGDFLEPFWKEYRPDPSAGHSTLAAADLIRLYGSHRRGIVEQRSRLSPHDTWSRRTTLVAMLRAAFPWVPDVVITMSDLQLLKDALPDSFILYREALYARAPFVDELTSLDPSGIYSRSRPAWFAQGNTPAILPDTFAHTFYPKSPEVLKILHLHGLEEGQFILLPLQSSAVYSFYDECDFSDQVEVMIAAATRFQEQNLLVTQHPDSRDTPPETMAAVKARYPNIVYVPELEAFGNPSARVLPYAAGVVGVSTHVLYQALVLGLPVTFLGKHALIPALDGVTTPDGRVGLISRLLTRFFAGNRYLHDGKWLLPRLLALELAHKGQLDPEALAIDLPGNVFKYLFDSRRPLDPT